MEQVYLCMYVIASICNIVLTSQTREYHIFRVSTVVQPRPSVITFSEVAISSDTSTIKVVQPYWTSRGGVSTCVHRDKGYLYTSG